MKPGVYLVSAENIGTIVPLANARLLEVTRPLRDVPHHLLWHEGQVVRVEEGGELPAGQKFPCPLLGVWPPGKWRRRMSTRYMGMMFNPDGTGRTPLLFFKRRREAVRWLQHGQDLSTPGQD